MTRETLSVRLDSYAPGKGVTYTWDDDFELTVTVTEGEVLFAGNAAAFRTIARHLLSMTQAYPGYHIHLEPSQELEDGSAPCIIEFTG